MPRLVSNEKFLRKSTSHVHEKFNVFKNHMFMHSFEDRQRHLPISLKAAHMVNNIEKPWKTG